jgi:hypothetical protein
MSEQIKTLTPVAALKGYFGLKPGQTSAEFLGELRELSAKDRDWLANEAAHNLGAKIKEG